jgi:hypothetical protein
MLARFKELGQANVGSRATANTQAQVWYNLLHAVARYIESAFSVAIRRLVDMNYAGVKRANAQMLRPDTPVREWIRRMIDAPQEDKDESAAMAEMERRQSALEEYTSIRQLEVKEPAETKRPRAENAKGAGEDARRRQAARRQRAHGDA